MHIIRVKKPEKVLVGGDFSQLEVKTAVYASKDEKMREAYMEGKDLYSIVASMAYNKPYSECLEFYEEGRELEIDGKKIICGKKEVTNKEGKARRQASKSILIGSIYQRGIPSIAQQIGKTKEETQAIMDGFYSGFPTMTQWFEDSKQFTLQHGYMDNAMGRRRRLPDALLPKYSITSSSTQGVEGFNPILGCPNKENTELIEKYKKKLENNGKPLYQKEYEEIKKQALIEGVEIHNNNAKIAETLRQCVNFQAQSLGADIVKKAMLIIDKDKELNDLGFELLIQVHDELIGECPKENAQAVADRLSFIMSDTAQGLTDNLPFSVDCYKVSNWYEDELETSLQDLMIKNNDKSKEEIYKIACEEHSELKPENIHAYMFDDKPLKIS